MIRKSYDKSPLSRAGFFSEVKPLNIEKINETCYHILTDGTKIGQLSLVERDGRLILDCFVEESHRHQGHGTQACNLLLEQLEEAEVSAVYACCEVGNSAAMRLCSRLGFELRSLRGEELWFVARL